MKTPVRILIVEDESLAVMAIKESLERTSYKICGEAADHDSAIALMKTESPDLVLLDIGLKGKPDGVTTAQSLKKIKPVLIFYITGRMEDETYERAKKTNPIGFLYKPFRPWDLVRQIDLALHNYHEGNPSENRLKSYDDDEQKTDLISTSDYLYLPDRTARFRIYIKNIIYLEADKGYTELFLTSEELDRLKRKIRRVVVAKGLSNILDYLPNTFYKLSRSVAINMDHLDRIETSYLVLGSYEVALPEGTRQPLLERLNAIRSRKRT
ncbi:response regulator [Spirosoma sp. SC4-14]|uniref:response regulator n=1 Tax=Spirosoma sp. SC4-14 TaxID=3128900 RepID=UPI0030D1FB38